MIRVIENYVIDCKGTTYIVKVNLGRKDKNGKDTYRTIASVSTLENAIELISKARLNSKLADGEYSLDEAIRIVQRSNKELADLLEKAFKEALWKEYIKFTQ